MRVRGGGEEGYGVVGILVFVVICDVYGVSVWIINGDCLLYGISWLLVGCKICFGI